MLYLCHMLTYGLVEYREISPFFCPIAFYQLQRFFYLLCQDTTQLTTRHSLIFLQQAAFLHFLVSYCTFGSFSLGCPSLSVNLENIYLYSVFWFGHLCCWKALHTKFHDLAWCSHRSPRFTPLNTNHIHSCLPVCFHYWTESPHTCLFKTPMEQCLLVLCSQKIHSFNG